MFRALGIGIVACAASITWREIDYQAWSEAGWIVCAVMGVWVALVTS